VTAEGRPAEARPLRPGKAARAVVSDGRAVRDAIDAVLAAPGESREVARRAYEAVRDQVVADALDAMPVDRLRDLMRGKATLAPLIGAGFETVGEVLAAGAPALRRIPQVSRRTARRAAAAALQLRASVEDSTRVRIDPDARTAGQAGLIAALRRYERSRSALKGPDLSPLAGEIGRRLDPAARAASRPRMLFTFPGRKKEEARDALAGLGAILSSKPAATARRRLARAEAELEKAGREPRAARLWNDYLARPVTYNGLLIEVAELDPMREASRLHLPGAKRQAAEREWAAGGGVAVTTYEALRAMPEDLDVPIAMMVVDEAHYAKNPNALRTRAVIEWASRSRRALFLTGTPMENRVAEFRALVGHLRTEVAESLDITDEALDGTRFREQVAPVYLRRNQEDVLSELPQRLETQEWVALDGAAMRAYRKAVLEGNFMAMRRAAFTPGTVRGSPKLRRLAEIAAGAEADLRHTIVAAERARLKAA
jgi:hypothetical protein